MVESKPTIGYWGIRGLGQYARYVFEAAGVEYVDKRYTDGTEWFGKDKPASPCLLPNLPYFTYKNVAISESDSIVRQAARIFKPELLGKSDAEQALVDNIFSFVMKWNAKLRTLSYQADVTDEQRAKALSESAV